MFRGVVETALSSCQIALVEKALAELAVGHRKSFLVSNNPMAVEGLFERRDGLLPLSFASFLQREIVVKNAERAIVFECAEEIQRLEVVGTGLFRVVGAGVKVAEIHQRMGDGVLIPLCALNAQHLSVA